MRLHREAASGCAGRKGPCEIAGLNSRPRRPCSLSNSNGWNPLPSAVISPPLGTAIRVDEHLEEVRYGKAPRARFLKGNLKFVLRDEL